MSARLIVRCECVCGLTGCASRYRNPTRERQHGLSGWSAGCRCDECRAAGRVFSRGSKKRRNDATRDKASRHGQQWTGAEYELALRDDLTATQVAGMIGRTREAVMNARYRCRTDPAIIRIVGAAS